MRMSFAKSEARALEDEKLYVANGQYGPRQEQQEVKYPSSCARGSSTSCEREHDSEASKQEDYTKANVLKWKI